MSLGLEEFLVEKYVAESPALKVGVENSGVECPATFRMYVKKGISGKFFNYSRPIQNQ